MYRALSTLGILPDFRPADLSTEEMTEYSRPFVEPGEGRRPTLTFPREIPIEGEPADVADPSFSLRQILAHSWPSARISLLPRSWPSQTEVTVQGVHFVQEDSPNEIGQAIAKWMRSLG